MKNQDHVAQAFDPAAPYFVSLNMLAWIVGEIYDIPWQKGTSGSPPMVVEQAKHGHGEIACMSDILTRPIEMLSTMSMPRSGTHASMQRTCSRRLCSHQRNNRRELLTHHQYMLLHECIKSHMDVRPHSLVDRRSIPLRVRTMGFGSMYHMFQEKNGYVSYDNMSGSRIGATMWATSMALHAAVICCTPKCRGTGREACHPIVDCTVIRGALFHCWLLRIPKHTILLSVPTVHVMMVCSILIRIKPEDITCRTAWDCSHTFSQDYRDSKTPSRYRPFEEQEEKVSSFPKTISKTQLCAPGSLRVMVYSRSFYHIL